MQRDSQPDRADGANDDLRVPDVPGGVEAVHDGVGGGPAGRGRQRGANYRRDPHLGGVWPASGFEISRRRRIRDLLRGHHLCDGAGALAEGASCGRADGGTAGMNLKSAKILVSVLVLVGSSAGFLASWKRIQ